MLRLTINTSLKEDLSHEDEAIVLNEREGYYSKDTKEFYFDIDGVRIYLETDADDDLGVLRQVCVSKLIECGECGEKTLEEDMVCWNCGKDS